MTALKIIKEGAVSWVNAPEQSERVLKDLRSYFDFSEADFRECLPPLQRSKIVERKGYFFLILHFPVSDHVHKRLRFTEVDMFVTKDTLTTVHDNELIALKDFFSHAMHDEKLRAKYMSGGAVALLVEIWKRLLTSSFDDVMEISHEINRLERKMFAKTPNKEIMEELLKLRTNIVTLRRTLGPQRFVLDRFALYAEKPLGLKSCLEEVRELKDFVAEIWYLLESHMESSAALHKAVESVIMVHTNDSMKIFTIISVITFPLTLLATLFAVRAGGTPLIDRPGGFWFLFWILMLGAGGMLHLFKKKGLM